MWPTTLSPSKTLVSKFVHVFLIAVMGQFQDTNRRSWVLGDGGIFFLSPSSILITGLSGCGKTFLTRLLQHFPPTFPTFLLKFTVLSGFARRVPNPTKKHDLLRRHSLLGRVRSMIRTDSRRHSGLRWFDGRREKMVLDLFTKDLPTNITVLLPVSSCFRG